MDPLTAAIAKAKEAGNEEEVLRLKMEKTEKSWIFYIDRTSRRDCDHCDSGGDAAAGAEQCKKKSSDNTMRWKSQTDRFDPAEL